MGGLEGGRGGRKGWVRSAQYHSQTSSGTATRYIAGREQWAERTWMPVAGSCAVSLILPRHTVRFD